MTLIGQDYMSTPSGDSNESLPLEAYDANAMNDILKDLGESFLNANSSLVLLVPEEEGDNDNNMDHKFDISAIPNHTTNCDDDDQRIHHPNSPPDQVNQQQRHSRHDPTPTSTAATRDRMDRSPDCRKESDNRNVSDDVDDGVYPFPSGDSNIHQIMDSSLLQVSLTSEASSPSPTAPRHQWQAYKSRNAQLHDRNTSLIKEIRFAEQTCVELSQEKQFLERELNQAHKIIEEEFWSKKQLLEKLEHLAESHDLLEQQLEQERDYQDEIKLEIENVRQSKLELCQELERERQNRLVPDKSSEQHQGRLQRDHPSNGIDLAEQLQQQTHLAEERERKLQVLLQHERDSKVGLEHQLETERQSKLQAEAQLLEECHTKTSLKAALQQALQHIEHQKQIKDAQPSSSDDELEMKWAMRIADLESRLAHAQQHNMPSPNAKLLMRIEELEAQNIYLKRQLPLKIDEPDGMAPIRPEKKPDAPNVARKLELEAQEEEDTVARNQVVDLKTMLEAVQLEYAQFKVREQERLNSVCETFEQKQVQLTGQLTSLQNEKQRLEEELARQRRVTADLTISRNDATTQESRRLEEELVHERHVSIELSEKLGALQKHNQNSQRLEEELVNQRHVSMELTEKLAALQKDYNRVVLSDQSLRLSLGDVKERLAHVENELVVAQKRSHSLENQLKGKDETFLSQLQAERQVLHDEFARVLKDAVLEMDGQADTVQAVLLSKIEEYRLRVVSLTSMVETLRSTLDFDFSEGNTDLSGCAHMREISAVPDITVLDATFRRNGVGDESLLHEMEEARLPSKDDHDAMHLSEISHDNSTSGWIKTMDISKIDDSAVIEVHKLQSSLSAAQNQIESYLESIGVLEQEIDTLERNRQHDSAKMHDLQNIILTSNSKIAELQLKLKSAERSSAAVEDLQHELQASQERVRSLECIVKNNEAKILDLQSQLEPSEADDLRHALSEAEAEIERLQVAFLACNDRLAGAFEAMANNEDLIGKFKESSDEAVKISIEAASSVRQDNLHLASKVAVLQPQLEQTQRMLRKKESEMAHLNDSKKEVMQALDETNKSLLKVTQERDAATASLRDLEMSIGHNAAERDAIANELKVVTKARMELEAQVLSASRAESATVELVRKLEDTAESLVKITKERDTMKIDHQMALEKLADASTRITVLSEELSTVKVSYNAALHRHGDVTAQLNEIVSNNADRIYELEEQLDASTKEKDHMRKTFMVLNERIAALTDEQEENTGTIVQLQESLAAAEADLVEVQQKYDTKMEDMEKILSDVAQVTDTIEKQKEEIIQLKSQLKGRDEENEMLRRDSIKAEESVERSTMEFSAYKRCMEERISERQTVLCEIQMFSETKQRELREKLASIKKSKDELLSQISDSLENFCNDFLESADECDVSFQGQADWQQSLHCAKLLVSTLLDTERGRADRLDAKLADANNELQHAASELAETTKELLETREAMETLQRAFSEKTELANSFCRERDEAHSRLVFLAGKLEEVSQDKESRKYDIAELEAFLIEHRGIASRLKTRAEQLEAKNLKLREYIRKLTSKCEEWQDSWNQQNRIILELRN